MTGKKLLIVGGPLGGEEGGLGSEASNCFRHKGSSPRGVGVPRGRTAQRAPEGVPGGRSGVVSADIEGPLAGGGGRGDGWKGGGERAHGIQTGSACRRGEMVGGEGRLGHGDGGWFGQSKDGRLGKIEWARVAGLGSSSSPKQNRKHRGDPDMPMCWMIPSSPPPPAHRVVRAEQCGDNDGWIEGGRGERGKPCGG